MAETRRGSDGSSGLPATVIFDKYELGRLLGCGAFAKVYHARDIKTGHSVAIKVINKKKIVGSSLVSNVKREISVMHRLNHPRIVKLHEVLATKTKIFFVMEFVKGGELFGKVAKGRFSEDLSRRFFQQLISAIGYCHMRGVFHRDLKPENLLVDENGDLKVSDFGLSAATGQIRHDGLLHTLCGTPAYVAPEILARTGYDGAKADVWSAGVVLYVLVAGYLPFNDPNLMAMYKKIYRGEFKCPRWFSPDLKRLFKRILDTNPETRITVNEILNDPWFQKGYQEMKFHEENGKTCNDDVDDKAKLFNAFDIISCSSGLNLSGLFVEAGESSDVDRIVSREAPEKILKTISELCENENLKLKKEKKVGLEMEEATGTWGIVFEIFPLTDDLVIVEIRRNGGDARAYEDALKSRIKPELVARISENSGIDFQ